MEMPLTTLWVLLPSDITETLQYYDTEKEQECPLPTAPHGPKACFLKAMPSSYFFCTYDPPYFQVTCLFVIS